jgi:hypothetical protein
MAVRSLCIAVLVVVVGLAAPAAAQPASDVLRDGNAAAVAGDWITVDKLVQPLLAQQLASADLAEAHRLAGLSAYFRGDRPTAELHFLKYLRIDLDGQLDPSLYPPDAITFFVDVRAKHNAELRARRKQPRRYWVLSLLPPFGQFQNGERTKGFLVGGIVAAFAIGNASSFFLLRSWCTRVTGEEGSSLTCDDSKDRASVAAQLRTINIVTGVGLILSYAYGVYDGVQGYRRKTREQRIQPFVTQTAHESFIGVAGSF